MSLYVLKQNMAIVNDETPSEEEESEDEEHYEPPPVKKTRKSDKEYDDSDLEKLRPSSRVAQLFPHEVIPAKRITPAIFKLPKHMT